MAKDSDEPIVSDLHLQMGKHAAKAAANAALTKAKKAIDEDESGKPRASWKKWAIGGAVVVGGVIALKLLMGAVTFLIGGAIVGGGGYFAYRTLKPKLLGSGEEDGPMALPASGEASSSPEASSIQAEMLKEAQALEAEMAVLRQRVDDEKK